MKKICDTCKCEFIPKHSTQRFCCAKCRNEAYSLICVTCGKHFKKFYETKYCSKHCYDNAFTNKCEVCGKVFNSRYQGTKYCSNECRKRMYTLTCKCCGKRFLACNKVAKYCSKECQNKKKLKSICLNCGNEFNSMYAAKYCSEDCRKEYSKNKRNDIAKEEVRKIVEFNVSELINRGIEAKNTFGISRNYTNTGFTSTIRDIVKERDNYECRVCNSRKSLEVHHIVKTIHGGNSNLENLITLCTSCHRAIDTLDIDYAITKCTNNANKNMGIYNPENILSKKDIFNTSLSQLHYLHRKISNANDETDIQEVLFFLGDIIDNLTEIQD